MAFYVNYSPLETAQYLEAVFLPSDPFRVCTYGKPKEGDPNKFDPCDKGQILKAGVVAQRLREGKPLDIILDDQHKPNAKRGVWNGANATEGSTDSDVLRLDNMVIECDDISPEEQIKRYRESGIPFKAMTRSGNKSVHLIIPIKGVTNKAEYGLLFEQVAEELKEKYGLNIDPQCKNPSRLTRLAGVWRNGQKQELIETRPPKDWQGREFTLKKANTTKNKAKGQGLTQFGESRLDICRKALEVIDPKDLDGEEWLKVLMACKLEGVSLEEIEVWNSRDPERVDVEKTRSRWQTLNKTNSPDEQCTYTYLIQLAHRYDPNFCPLPKERADHIGKPKKPNTILADCKHALKALNACLLNEKVLHVYDKEAGYISDPARIRQRIAKLFKGSKRPHEITEIHKYMEDNAPLKAETIGENLIQFKNCVLNMDTLEVEPRSPERIIRNTIPWEYDPAYPWKLDPSTGMVKNAKGERNPKAEFAEKVLTDWMCGNDDMKELLLQCVGYSMLINTPLHGFFLLIGKKRNGKSVFCDWLRAVLGYSNTSAIPMDEIGARFSTYSFYDKLANIADENKGKYLEECTILKNASAGGQIEVEGKGLARFKAYCVATMIFSYNQDFRVDDQAGALRDRTNVILFNADYSDRSKQDHSLTNKLKDPECVEYLIQRGVQALYRALTIDGRFILPQESAEWLRRQDRINNPVLEFIEFVEADETLLYYENYEGDVLKGKGFEKFLQNPVGKIYGYYKTWCEEQGLKALSQTKFGKDLQRFRKLKSKQKKTNEKNIRYYVILDE